MPVMSETQWGVFAAAAARITPDVAQLDEAGAARFRAIVEDSLATRPASLRRQFGLFLGVLRWVPAVRHGRPLERLPAARQDAVLAWFEDNPVTLLRLGFWGLKSMVCMGYYGQPEIAHRVHYRPSNSGNDALAR